MTDVQFSGCDLQIPHKQWSGDPWEERNYYAIERWALNFRQNCVRSAMSEASEVEVDITGCDLHIPHKDWSTDWRERENYLAIERWAMHFRKNCIPPCPDLSPPEVEWHSHGAATNSGGFTPGNASVNVLPSIGSTTWPTLDFHSLVFLLARRIDGATPPASTYTVSVGPDPGYTMQASLTFASSGTDDAAGIYRVEAWAGVVPAGTAPVVVFHNGPSDTNTRVMHQNINFHSPTPLTRLSVSLAEVYSAPGPPSTFNLTYPVNGSLHVAACIAYASGQDLLAPYPNGPLSIGDTFCSLGTQFRWPGAMTANPGVARFGEPGIRGVQTTTPIDSYNCVPSGPPPTDTSALWKGVALSAVYTA